MRKNISLFFILFFLVSFHSNAQQPVTKMQSLYIYNFIKNIKWKNVESKYIVGVFADEQVVTEIINTIGVRKFNGKDIEVKKISSPEQAAECQIVFVTADYKSIIAQLNNPTVLKNTLLVSEEGGLENGASIAFFLDDAKLKFKINEPVCKSSNLQISATLLSLSQ